MTRCGQLRSLHCHLHPIEDTSGPVVIPFNSLRDWRKAEQVAGRTVVTTNGCFDILHVGHLRYLQEAASLGDTLIVGINDDAGVRELKGADRPLNTGADRAELLDALAPVDAVTIFPGARAEAFLQSICPDIYVKGGDYTIDDLYPPEVTILREAGSDIRILPLTPGKSTSTLLSKINSGS